MAAHAPSFAPEPLPAASDRPRPVDRALVAEVAREAVAHPNTVLKRLAGLEVRGIRGRAIDAALERRGIRPGNTAG